MSKQTSTPHGSREEANIYLHAASEIADGFGSFACCEIGLPGDPARERFTKFFRPMVKDNCDPCPRENGWYGQARDMEARAARVVALCFMAAMVEAGDA